MFGHVAPMPAQAGSLQSILIVCGLLMLVLLAGLGALMWLRRRMRAADEGGRTEAFSVESLERMRLEGRITDEEFKRLRRQALGLVGAGGEKPISPSSPPLSGDDEGDEPGGSGSDRTRDE